MAAPGGGFSQALQTITNTKLEELAKQQAAYNQQYSELLAAAEAEPEPLARLFLLVDGAKSCLGVKTAIRKNNDDGRLGRVISGGTANNRLETDLKNLDRFLEQARYDPSVSLKVLEDWEKCIRQYLRVRNSKYEYADLYGKLVTEWLSCEKTASSDGDVEMTESFEELPGAKKLEARTAWEKVVFQPADVNIQALNAYLHNLFTKKKGVSKAMDALREKVEQFEHSLTGSAQFNVSTLRWVSMPQVIQGLQSSDLLTNENREALKEFLSNDTILSEIADVLNMRLTALSRWTWGDHVPLEQRRNLNGAYSIHMQEDLLQAIFLHYIGVRWSAFFKNALVEFRDDAWKSNIPAIPKAATQRRGYYLGYDGTARSNTLENRRADDHKQIYYLHQLLDHEQQKIEVQEGEQEAEYHNFVNDESVGPRKRSRPDDYAPADGVPITRMTQAPMRQGYASYAPMQHMQMQQQQMQMQQAHAQAAQGMYSAHDNENRNGRQQSPSKKPMEAKQGILHILSAEIIINKQLNGELTCFRSVFDSWNPLLPHDTILAVVKFFGVTEKWASFFKSFLEAPLTFIEDSDATPRLRRRGTPGSHSLSDVFGETILFCLDYAVNQSTEGGMLHRIYDDFWFWSRDYNKCVKAWSSVQQFTAAMGVSLNDAKTGSVRITKDAELRDADDALPKGDIRWGLLYLDPSTGHFEIDKKMVDAHVEELRKQLQSKKSIIDWIQAWNSFAAAFFSSNFGKPANCFGREHVDNMLAIHRHVQERIFDGGNVVQFLKKTIKERFHVNDVPDGFLFFPVELGGLDLKSPFVGLLQIREAVIENPSSLVDAFEEAEKEDYVHAKKAFDRGDIRHQRHGLVDKKWKPSENADQFFSFEEFVQFREVLGNVGRADLVGVYGKLLKKPKEEGIDISAQVKQALEELQGQATLKCITSRWNSMEPYWKWVAQMYGPEMFEKFGGLNVVDPGLLPIGMVNMFRQKRIKWQG